MLPIELEMFLRKLQQDPTALDPLTSATVNPLIGNDTANANPAPEIPFTPPAQIPTGEMSPPKITRGRAALMELLPLLISGVGGAIAGGKGGAGAALSSYGQGRTLQQQIEAKRQSEQIQQMLELAKMAQAGSEGAAGRKSREDIAASNRTSAETIAAGNRDAANARTESSNKARLDAATISAGSKSPSASLEQWNAYVAGEASKLGKSVDQLSPQELGTISENYKKVGSATDILVPVVKTNKDGSQTVVYEKRSTAEGKEAPRTIFDPQGISSVGGVKGASTVAPPTLPETTMDRVIGYKTALDLFSNIDLKKTPTLGPVAGRVALAEIDKLGGLGASKQDIELAQKLRRLVTEQAFANGGKQLTPTEKEEFIRLNPSLNDTLDTALIKTKDSIAYLRTKLGNTIKALTPRQRALIDKEFIKAYEEPTGSQNPYRD